MKLLKQLFRRLPRAGATLRLPACALALAFLLLSGMEVSASNVVFILTNSSTMLRDTNDFKIVPLGTIRNADGTFNITGLPLRVHNPSGVATNYLVPQYYQVTNQFIGAGFYLRIFDWSSNSIYAGDPSIYCGGANPFVELTTGAATNVQLAATGIATITTNIPGGSFTVNVPSELPAASNFSLTLGANSSNNTAVVTTSTFQLNSNLSLTIGGNDTNFTRAMFLLASNFSLTMGANATNDSLIKFQLASNFTLTLGAALSNYVASATAGSGAGGASTNFVLLVGNNLTNFTLTLGANGTNDSLAKFQLASNQSLTLGANGSNNTAVVTTSTFQLSSNLSLTIGGNDTNFTRAVFLLASNFSLTIGANLTNLVAAQGTSLSNWLAFVQATVGRNTNYLFGTNFNPTAADGVFPWSGAAYTNGAAYGTNDAAGIRIYVSGISSFGSASGYWNGPWTNISGTTPGQTAFVAHTNIAGPNVTITRSAAGDVYAAAGTPLAAGTNTFVTLVGPSNQVNVPFGIFDLFGAGSGVFTSLSNYVAGNYYLASNPAGFINNSQASATATSVVNGVVPGLIGAAVAGSNFVFKTELAKTNDQIHADIATTNAATTTAMVTALQGTNALAHADMSKTNDQVHSDIGTTNATTITGLHSDISKTNDQAHLDIATTNAATLALANLNHTNALAVEAIAGFYNSNTLIVLTGFSAVPAANTPFRLVASNQMFCATGEQYYQDPNSGQWIEKTTATGVTNYLKTAGSPVGTGFSTLVGGTTGSAYYTNAPLSAAAIAAINAAVVAAGSTNLLQSQLNTIAFANVPYTNGATVYVDTNSPLPVITNLLGVTYNDVALAMSNTVAPFTTIILRSSQYSTNVNWLTATNQSNVIGYGYSLYGNIGNVLIQGNVGSFNLRGLTLGVPYGTNNCITFGVNNASNSYAMFDCSVWGGHDNFKNNGGTLTGPNFSFYAQNCIFHTGTTTGGDDNVSANCQSNSFWKFDNCEFLDDFPYTNGVGAAHVLVCNGGIWIFNTPYIAGGNNSNPCISVSAGASVTINYGTITGSATQPLIFATGTNTVVNLVGNPCASTNTMATNGAVINWIAYQNDSNVVQQIPASNIGDISAAYVQNPNNPAFTINTNILHLVVGTLQSSTWMLQQANCYTNATGAAIITNDVTLPPPNTWAYKTTIAGFARYSNSIPVGTYFIGTGTTPAIQLVYDYSLNLKNANLTGNGSGLTNLQSANLVGLIPTTNSLTRYVTTNLTAATSVTFQLVPSYQDTNFGVQQDISSGLPATFVITGKTTNTVSATMGIFTGTEGVMTTHQ